MNPTTKVPKGGINAAFREDATRDEIRMLAAIRRVERESRRRLAIDQGGARAGDYVKGLQYAFANGHYLSKGHVFAEGRVVDRSGERMTIERGDGTRFTILARDENTSGFSWKEVKRYTSERKAKADAIRAERTSSRDGAGESRKKSRTTS